MIPVKHELSNLSASACVYIDTARVSVMDGAVDHGRIGAFFHFETGDSVVVYVALLKIALKKRE